MAVVAGNSDLRIKESFVMIYSDFHGEKLSRLGLGMMRLPTNADGTIDEGRTAEMIDYAIKNGINYFDTAYPYHGEYCRVIRVIHITSRANFPDMRLRKAMM